MGNQHVLAVFVLCMLAFISATLSIPFIVLQGLGDECKHQGVKHFTELLSNWSGSQVATLSDMYFFSQSEWLCILFVDLIKVDIYSRFVQVALFHLSGANEIFMQEHLAPSNYFKIPTDIFAYINGGKFLPKLNNEIMNMKNYTYKQRFASLENLVLIMFEQDTVLIPKEKSWFGYYPDGAFYPVLPAQETELYTQDWIGLKTLDEAGKVKFINVSGNHLEISVGDIEKYMVPFLKDQTSTPARPEIVRPSSAWHLWSSLSSFAFQAVGLKQDWPLLLIVG